MTVSSLSQPSAFVPWTNVVCGGKTYNNVSAHTSTLAVSFNDTQDNVVILLKFTFQESAVYSSNATARNTSLCDDTKTIYLTQIELMSQTSPKANMTVSVDPSTWNWTKGNSYSCDNSFTFTIFTMESVSLTLTISNVQTQAFMTSPAFSSGMKERERERARVSE